MFACESTFVFVLFWRLHFLVRHAVVVQIWGLLCPSLSVPNIIFMRWWNNVFLFKYVIGPLLCIRINVLPKTFTKELCDFLPSQACEPDLPTSRADRIVNDREWSRIIKYHRCNARAYQAMTRGCSKKLAWRSGRAWVFWKQIARSFLENGTTKRVLLKAIGLRKQNILQIASFFE